MFLEFLENVEQYTGSCTDIPLSCLCYPCHYAGLIFEARVLCAHGAVVMQPKVDRLHLKAGLVRSLSSQDGYSASPYDAWWTNSGVPEWCSRLTRPAAAAPHMQSLVVDNFK